MRCFQKQTWTNIPAPSGNKTSRLPRDPECVPPLKILCKKDLTNDFVCRFGRYAHLISHLCELVTVAKLRLKDSSLLHCESSVLNPSDMFVDVNLEHLSRYQLLCPSLQLEKVCLTSQKLRSTFCVLYKIQKTLNQ